MAGKMTAKEFERRLLAIDHTYPTNHIVRNGHVVGFRADTPIGFKQALLKKPIACQRWLAACEARKADLVAIVEDELRSRSVRTRELGVREIIACCENPPDGWQPPAWLVGLCERAGLPDPVTVSKEHATAS